MFELPVEFESTYVGPELRLTVPWFFRIFQDAALQDSERIGYNASKTIPLGLLWVFSRVYVRFDHMPAYLSKGKFVTYSGAKKAFLFPRFGKLLDEKGEVCAQVSSVFALIHKDDRKVEMHPPLESVDQCLGDEIPLSGKVVSAPVHYRGAKIVEYADLDLNGHFNNVRYIELLMNLHDPAFYETNQISELLIQYESEIRFGERVEIYADEEMNYVRGVVGDRICFEANISYSPVKK